MVSRSEVFSNVEAQVGPVVSAALSKSRAPGGGATFTCTAHLPDYAVPGARVIVLGSRGGFDNHVRFHATVIKLLADGRAHVRFERDMEGNTLPICLPIIKTACERTTG